MLRIIVDNNNDKISIMDEDSSQNMAIFVKVPRPRLISNIIEEIFNQLDDSRLASATPSFNIRLEYIDEDVHSTKGEW